MGHTAKLLRTTGRGVPAQVSGFSVSLEPLVAVGKWNLGARSTAWEVRPPAAKLPASRSNSRASPCSSTLTLRAFRSVAGLRTSPQSSPRGGVGVPGWPARAHPAPEWVVLAVPWAQ